MHSDLHLRLQKKQKKNLGDIPGREKLCQNYFWNRFKTSIIRLVEHLPNPAILVSPQESKINKEQKYN